MDDEFEAFIEAQKAQLAQERKELTNEPNAKTQWNRNSEGKAAREKNRNGFKENLPPKPMTPDVGLVAKLGGYSEKRQKLQEERRQEYNKMLAEQKMKPGGKSSKDAPQGNSRRDPDYNQWNDGGPPRPPRKGWATPTYEEILERKRKQERNYRLQDDPFDRNMNLGDADYNRVSVSDGNLNQRFNEDNARLVALDREFEEKKVRFLNDRRPSSNPNGDSSNVYDEHQSQYNQPRKNSQPQDVQLQTFRQNLRKTGSEPENFNGTLMIGKELRVSQDRRNKGAYRQELEQQMEEAKARKIREKMEARQTADGLMDRMAPGRMEQPPAPAKTVSLNPGFQPSLLPQASPMYTMQTKNAMIDDMGLRRGGGGEGGFYEDRVTGVGGILANGFDFNTKPSPFSNAAPENSLGLMPSLNPYSSPLSDAYHYYGMQNPLDPNLAYGVPNMPSLVPPAQVMSTYPMSLNMVPDVSQQMSAQLPPEFLRPSAIPPPSVGPSSNFPLSAFNSQKRDTGGILGENLDERKHAEDEKKKMYQMDLQRQMGEDKLKKQRQKEEQDKYDKKLEAEIAKYSPFGQPGGGAPMRDKYGNIISARKPEMVAPAWAQNAPNSHVATDHQMGGLADPYNPFDHNRPSDPLLGLYRSPLSEHQAKPYASFLAPRPGLQDQAAEGRADGEAKFARGGHGIFGEPMTDEQKNVKIKYQDELRKQIEEKKRRAEEEKLRQQKEEELLLKRIEEDNLKIQKEQEEEKRKLREKAEQAERQQQELKRQQEEQKQEAEQKKKEAQEARHQEQLKARQQEDEDKHKAEELERIKSPPVPAAAAASRKTPNSRPTQQVMHQQRKSSPVPVDRPKSQQSQRMQSARALDHLARMKQKLNSERKRVESDLKKEQMAPEVFDPRLVIGRPPRHHDAGIFETARNNSSSARGRKGAPSPQEAYPYVFDEQREIKTDDDFHDNPLKGDRPPIREGLEEWQRLQLERQEEELKMLKQHRSFAEDNLPGEGVSRPGSNLLEAQTEFFGIPDSRADNHHFPDDLEDMKTRPKSSSNRRHRKVKISVEPAESPLSRMGSVTSLDPEELKRKNEERLRKLKSLEGDDISTGNPDDILKHFMETRKHSRPPSSNTLMDDSWLRPGSTGH